MNILDDTLYTEKSFPPHDPDAKECGCLTCLLKKYAAVIEPLLRPKPDGRS